ncbi:MAG: PD40 domain-containing protein [Bacteroidetes bacterium]|nr:PD40 domain-containing protein [Bacteroidota bacterium]
MKLYAYLLVYLFTLCVSGLHAQKKDSLLQKTTEVKEEFLQSRKRKFTYIVSDRLSEDERFDIFKITPMAEPPHVIIVRGHIDVVEDPSQKKVRITVYNASNNERVGIFSSNPYTGNYILVLVANVKYIFHVEVAGYGIMQEEVEVPLKIDYEICRQILKVKLNEKKKPVLVVNNFFSDDNEKMFYIKASGDTSKTLAEDQITSNKAKEKGINKKEKNYSTIDDMVKKQVEEENKKPVEALKAFKSNDFRTSALYYEALLKNDPGDPFANYYYGVSLLKLNQNKAKAINSLQLASGYKEIPVDVFLYLGRAYHLSYIFQDAILALEEYKKRAQPAQFESNQVPQLIKYCKNAGMLMSDPVNMEVIKRIKVQEANFLANYNPDLISERLAYKTDFFNSAEDKKKNAKLLICNLNKQEYIHASYGAKEITGTDLYKNKLTPQGNIGKSELLGNEINTSLDEDYPFISKDGLTLYFSSKGHNSMGGFDIFKSTRADILSAWSKPENLGYPINSTYDDILFIPDTAGKYASFCSNRKGNSYELIHFKIPQGNPPSSVIKGNFSTLDSIPVKDAIISVYNSNSGEIAGVYRTNTATGNYLMILPAGIKYDMTVSADGFAEYTSSFEIPAKKNEFTLKQIIKIKRKAEKPLIVNNYFMEDQAAAITFDETPSKENTKVNKESLSKKESKAKKRERTPDEKIKDQEDLQLAKKLVDNANYQEAALVYQTLEYHLDLDPFHLYNYGISLFHTKKDRTGCIKALEAASTSSSKLVPADVYYHLAKANQLSYRFTESIKAYTKFAALCKPDEAAKLKINKEIEHCNNGIQLVNNPVVMEVHERKHADIKALQNSLTHAESGAKVLVLTDDMRSAIDKKKNYNALLFLSADKNTLLYTSYGEDELKGKDIYRLRKLSNGKWSPVPENISAVNSELDEEFPTLSKDGKTLYFSSKGYDNMGGYDIFKSTFSEEKNEWSKPVNMGSPINSPYDDMYFLE